MADVMEREKQAQTPAESPAPPAEKKSLRKRWKDLPRKKRRRVIRLLILLILLAAGGGAAYHFLGSGRGGPGPAPTVQQTGP